MKNIRSGILLGLCLLSTALIPGWVIGTGVEGRGETNEVYTGLNEGAPSYSGSVNQYIVSGIIRNAEYQNVLTNVDIYFTNVDTEDVLMDTTDANGAYSVDLADFESGIEEGDFFLIEASAYNYLNFQSVIYVAPDKDTLAFDIDMKYYPIGVLYSLPTGSFTEVDRTYQNQYAWWWNDNVQGHNLKDDYSPDDIDLTSENGVIFSNSVSFTDSGAGLGPNDRYLVTLVIQFYISNTFDENAPIVSDSKTYSWFATDDGVEGRGTTLSVSLNRQTLEQLSSGGGVVPNVRFIITANDTVGPNGLAYWADVVGCNAITFNWQ